MRIESPLSNLCDILEQVRASAQQYRSTLIKNEAATWAVLVDPILRALGWDTANTFMVEVEKTFNKTRVDYALFDSNGAVCVIVEAKSLSDNLAHPQIIMSLVTYAFTVGLTDIFLTDGIVWHHFTEFQPGRVAPAKVINLATDNAVECAAYLVHRLDAAKFWPERQGLDALTEQVNQLESLVSSLQQQLSALQLASPNAFAEVLDIKRAQAIPAGSEIKLDAPSFVALDKLPDLTGAKPLILRLPDGTCVEVRKWRDVLLHACKFTLARSVNLPVPLPDMSGRKVELLSLSRPPSGISCSAEQYQGQTIYIYTNYSAQRCIANAEYILDKLPMQEKKVTPALAFDEAG